MALVTLQSSGNLIADRRFAYGQDLNHDGETQAALELYEQTLELVPNYAPAWFELGKARIALNRPDAETAFKRCLELEPEDRLGAGLYLYKSISSAYITSLFDSYAQKFDVHLTKTLNYRGPEILRHAVEKYCAEQSHDCSFETIIDIGCGTGLSGVQFTHMTKQLIGCDLSPQMIEQAQRKNIYSELFIEDAVTCLARYKCNMVLAVDVLVYIGDLYPLFKQVKKTLILDGLFAFSIQNYEGQGFKLGEDIRYAHSLKYIQDTATVCNLNVKWFNKISTRQDRGQDVPGLIIIMGL